EFILQPYLHDYLFRTAAYALLQQRLGSALSLSAKPLRILLDGVLLIVSRFGPRQSLYQILTDPKFLASAGTDASDPDFAQALSVHRLLAKIAVLVLRLSMTVADIATVASTLPMTNVLTWSELPLSSTAIGVFDDWRLLVTMLGLARRQPGGRDALYAL